MAFKFLKFIHTFMRKRQQKVKNRPTYTHTHTVSKFGLEHLFFFVDRLFKSLIVILTISESHAYNRPRDNLYFSLSFDIY